MEHRAERRQGLHDLASPADGADGQSAADDLAERRQVGRHRVLGLGAAVAQAEPGDHLVEHQQCADPVAFGAQTLQEAIGRGDDPHVGRNGLDDHRGDLLVELRHDVVRHHQSVGHGTGGHTGGAGQSQRGDATATGCQQGVGRAVKVAVEDHQAIAAREAARQAHSGAGRLGAGVHQPHHVAAADTLGHRLGQQHLAGCGCAVRRALGGRSVDRGGDDGMSVPEDDRAVALHQVDVPAALDIPDVRSLGALDDVRRAADRLEGPDAGVDPAGDHPAAAFEEFGVGAHCCVSANHRAR